jgi:hypothetical protein
MRIRGRQIEGHGRHVGHVRCPPAGLEQQNVVSAAGSGREGRRPQPALAPGDPGRSDAHRWIALRPGAERLRRRPVGEAQAEERPGQHAELVAQVLPLGSPPQRVEVIGRQILKEGTTVGE